MMFDEAIYSGGLMRCCLETINERTEPAADGERQSCKYCSSAVVFAEEQITHIPEARGAWRWEGAA